MNEVKRICSESKLKESAVLVVNVFLNVMYNSNARQKWKANEVGVENSLTPRSLGTERKKKKKKKTNFFCFANRSLNYTNKRNLDLFVDGIIKGTDTNPKSREKISRPLKIFKIFFPSFSPLKKYKNPSSFCFVTKTEKKTKHGRSGNVFNKTLKKTKTDHVIYASFRFLASLTYFQRQF